MCGPTWLGLGFPSPNPNPDQVRARVADCGPAEVRQGLAATQLTTYLKAGETVDSQAQGSGSGLGSG